MNLSETLSTLQSGFSSRKTFSIDHRISRLKSLHQAIERNQKKILAALHTDLGRSDLDGFAAEIALVQNEIQTFLRQLKKWSKPQKVSTPLFFSPGKSRVEWIPKGCVLILSPWNYPFLLSLRPIVGAVGAGCCFILKPSEHSSATSQVLNELITEVFPPDEGICLLGDSALAQELLQSPWDHIFFTGSSHVGQIIYQAAAKTLSPVTLELGGKNPCVVWEDARLGVAAKRITWGKFLNCGQTCVAPDTLYVQSSVHQELLELLKKTISRFYGHAPLSTPHYGKIIHRRGFDRLVEFLTTEKPLLGGKSSPNELKLEPTLVDTPPQNSKLWGEEIFGPVLPIVPFKNEAELNRHLNAHHKDALSASVFSEDPHKIEVTRQMIRTGAWCINDAIVNVAHPRLPFGGIGKSGIGAYSGKLSFELFSHAQAVMETATWFDQPLRYPPHPKLTSLLERLLQFFLS